jgi:hypothetical protein
VALSTIEGLGLDILYTGLHEETGRRIAIDRDEDGGLDGDEADLGTDEANPDDTAFVGTGIPADVDALNTFTTLSLALGFVTPTAGKNAAIHIKGGNYAGAITIDQPVVLKTIVNPVTGNNVGGTVVIGAP